MKLSRIAAGHLAAFITILIWGITFVSIKMLLRTFSPVEILFIRFVVGYLALWLICPRSLCLSSAQQEALYAVADFYGVTIYYLLENIALTYTLVSNMGVIISTALFFTAILGQMFLGEERPRFRFFAGFLLATAGISLISFGNGTALSLNPTGDSLAVAATVIWAVYSALTKKISALGHDTVQSTERTFFYGIPFMVPALTFMDFCMVPVQFTDMKNTLNLLFLGLGASVLCFVIWNTGVKILGVVKTSIYIYMVPVVITLTSAPILKEPITVPAALRVIMTLTGLLLSERKTTGKGKSKIWATKMRNVQW